MIYNEFPSPLCFVNVSPIVGTDESLETRFNINIYCSLGKLAFPQGKGEGVLVVTGRNLTFPPKGKIMSINKKELKLSLGINVFEFIF
jgi:hypothetical protein